MGAFWGSLAAMTIGASDIFSRRLTLATTAMTAAFVVQVLAIVTAASMLLVFDSAITWADTIWGGLSGLGMLAGLACYLEGMRRSSATVVAPTTATLAALIPFIYAIARGEQVSAFGMVGAGVAMIGLVLIARGQGELVGLREGLKWSSLSGVSYGFAISVLLEVSDDSGVWPAVPQRIVAAVVLLLVLLSTKTTIVPPRPEWRTGIMAGLVTGLSSVFLLIGVAADAPAAVITQSMFPAVSVVVGFFIFGDGVARRQIAGIALVLAGCAALVA